MWHIFNPLSGYDKRDGLSVHENGDSEGDLHSAVLNTQGRSGPAYLYDFCRPSTKEVDSCETGPQE